MSSMSHRPPAQAPLERAPRPDQAPASEGPSNSLLVDLVTAAAEAIGQGAGFFGLSEDDPQLGGGAPAWSEDPGKYDFPEGGEQPTPLPAVREKHQETAVWQEQEGGTAFVQGEGDAHAVDPNDVAQGALGNCYLMAGMVAVARANPSAIQDLIQDNGDGTYQVTLYLRPSAREWPKPVTQTVDLRLAMGTNGRPLYAKTGDKADGQVELWAALLEKRVAMEKGSYEKISGGNIAKDGFQFHGATELLTGKTEGYFSTSGMSEDDAMLHIALALEAKKPVTADSKDMSNDAEMAAEAEKQNVYGNHAYAPFEADLDAMQLSFTNPWGSDHVEDLPVESFLKWYRGIRVGA